MSNRESTRQRFADFPSQQVPARHIELWLPPDYHQSSSAYPVLYMHDGQNLFDAATAYGGVTWGVDEVLRELISTQKVPPVIAVGIWNTARRFSEYLPQRPFKDGPLPDEVEGVYSDSYLSFIVEELKPFIDAQFRTLSAREHTHIMGSSMGGLVSLYAICEYPDLFGSAGCLSTHWPIMAGKFDAYLRDSLPDPA
ncbi:MAG: alpha/beta hydrolase-fold protein, partial [Chloroflexota bacterium]